jgi:hypothetical protein
VKSFRRKTAAAAAQRATAASDLGVLALAEQVGHHEATQTAPPQNTAPDQHAHELALMAATFLFTAAFLVLVFLGAASFLHATLEQVSQHEPTQAAAAYSPADQHANKSALLATPFAAFAVDVGAFEDIVHSRGVIWHCNLAPKS